MTECLLCIFTDLFFCVALLLSFFYLEGFCRSVGCFTTVIDGDCCSCFAGDWICIFGNLTSILLKNVTSNLAIASYGYMFSYANGCSTAFIPSFISLSTGTCRSYGLQVVFLAISIYIQFCVKHRFTGRIFYASLHEIYMMVFCVMWFIIAGLFT